MTQRHEQPLTQGNLANFFENHTKTRRSPGRRLVSVRISLPRRQQRDLAGTLDRHGQLTLMDGAGTGRAARKDLAALGQIAAQLRRILVIDLSDLVDAEAANLLALMRTSSVVSHESFLLCSDL